MTKERKSEETAVTAQMEGVENDGLNVEALISAGVSVNWKKMKPEDKGILIHEISQGLINQAQLKDKAWMNLGMIWRFVIANKIYKHAGDHIKNANDFLRELDLGIKRREIETYAQMVGIFGRYLRTKGKEIPIRKLVMIAPFCKGDEDITNTWVEKADRLPTPALQDEIREAKGQPARDTCTHPDDRQEVWTRCGVCGKFLQRMGTSG